MRSRGCAKTSNNGHVNYNVAQGNELVIFSLGKYFRSIFFSFFFFRRFSFIRRFRIDYAHVKREKSLSLSLSQNKLFDIIRLKIRISRS